MDFKFCRNIQMVDPNKSPWKMLGMVAMGVVRESRKFSGHPCMAHCAVIFAIAQLSCFNIKFGLFAPAKRIERWATFSRLTGFSHTLIVNADWVRLALLHTLMRWRWLAALHLTRLVTNPVTLKIGKNSIKLKIFGVDYKIIWTNYQKSPVLLQIWRHDETGQSINFSLPKILLLI